MQVVIHVLSNSGDSLRKRIANDRRLEEYHLQVARQKKSGRSPGWLTLHSTYADGAIKVEWSDASHTLLCRVVTRRRGRPERIVGDFVCYLMARMRRRIEAITLAGWKFEAAPRKSPPRTFARAR